MVKKYILIVLLLSNNLGSAKAGWFGNNNNDVQQQTQQQQTQQQQTQQQQLPQQIRNNYGGRGTVTGVMNRIPRNFNTQTLLNTGPGLLQETFLLFRRFGSKKTNKGTKIETIDDNSPTVLEPQPPEEPQIIHEESGRQETVLTQTQQNTQTHYTEEPFNKHTPLLNDLEPILGNDPPPPNTPQPILMLPAPQPGFIIRYNQERGVYEEVREISIPQTQQILPVQPLQ